MTGKRIRLISFCLGFLLIAGRAHAYIDPGTGSLVLQGLIAALLASTVAIRAYWSRLKSVFRRKAGPGEALPGDDDTSPSTDPRGE